MQRDRLTLRAEDLTDDELLAAGAALERRRQAVGSELEKVRVAVSGESSAIRKATIKLAVNAAIAVGGVIAAPLTFGTSLLLTIGGIAMLLWDDTIDHARDVRASARLA